jgi:hypothetical protein
MEEFDRRTDLEERASFIPDCASGQDACSTLVHRAPAPANRRDFRAMSSLSLLCLGDHAT